VIIEEEIGWGCSGIGTSPDGQRPRLRSLGIGGSEETKKKYFGMLTESLKLASFCSPSPTQGPTSRE